MILRDTVFLRIFGARAANIHDEGVFDAEDCVGGFVRVVAEVESPNLSAPNPALTSPYATPLRGEKTYVIK